jgi:hypothetical protein
MRSWTWRRWATAAVVSILTAIVIGVPTGIIETPFYTRMTPVLWWNYPVWAASAVLTGLLVATYVRPPAALSKPGAGRVTAGGVLTFLAVGCPICNKIVVALIGVSGALNLWAPIQPPLGLVSLALLGYGLYIGLRGERACRLPTPAGLARRESQPAGEQAGLVREVEPVDRGQSPD